MRGVVELTARNGAQTFGDGAGGVAGRSYSDNLACEWRLRVGAGERIRITFSTLRVWAGDTLTVHAESYKGLVADALVAKLVTAPTGGVTLPALSAAGPLVVRFSTDARSEGFYNAAADGAEDNDGFVASFVRAPPCSGPDDCGGEACDGDGECACAAAGRGGADCSHAHCMGTSVVATPGTLRSHAAYGVGSYHDDAECIFVITASGGGADIRLTVTHDLEATFDFLEVYSGAGTGGVLYARLTGTGTTVVTVPATDGAATLHFTSDAMGRRGGFTVAYENGISQGRRGLRRRQIRDGLRGVSAARRTGRSRRPMGRSRCSRTARCRRSPIAAGRSPPAAAASSSMRSTSRASRPGPTAPTT